MPCLSTAQDGFGSVLSYLVPRTGSVRTKATFFACHRSVAWNISLGCIAVYPADVPLKTGSGQLIGRSVSESGIAQWEICSSRACHLSSPTEVKMCGNANRAMSSVVLSGFELRIGPTEYTSSPPTHLWSIRRCSSEKAT